MGEWSSTCDDLVLMSGMADGGATGLYLEQEHRKRKDVCFPADGRVSA